METAGIRPFLGITLRIHIRDVPHNLVIFPAPSMDVARFSDATNWTVSAPSGAEISQRNACRLETADERLYFRCAVGRRRGRNSRNRPAPKACLSPQISLEQT